MSGDEKFHTIYNRIAGGRLHMDTLNQREGIHLWIRRVDDPNESVSVHLTRTEARFLVEEINARLF